MLLIICLYYRSTRQCKLCACLTGMCLHWSSTVKSASANLAALVSSYQGCCNRQFCGSILICFQACCLPTLITCIPGHHRGELEVERAGPGEQRYECILLVHAAPTRAASQNRPSSQLFADGLQHLRSISIPLRRARMQRAGGGRCD